MKIKIPFFNKPKPREIYEPSQIDFLLTEGTQSSPHNTLPWWRKKQKMKDEKHVCFDEPAVCDQINNQTTYTYMFLTNIFYPNLFK